MGGVPKRSPFLDFLPWKIRGWGSPVPCNREQDLAILLRIVLCSHFFNQHITRPHRRGTLCQKHYPPPKSPPASPAVCSFKKYTFPHALVLLDPLPRLSHVQGHKAGSRWADPVLLGNQGWQARLMLMEDITKRMARRALVDARACMHTFESKGDMAEATRKTSRIARNHHCSSHCDIHADRVSKLSGSLRLSTTGKHQNAWGLFYSFITEKISLCRQSA